MTPDYSCPFISYVAKTLLLAKQELQPCLPELQQAIDLSIEYLETVRGVNHLLRGKLEDTEFALAETRVALRIVEKKWKEFVNVYSGD